MKEDILEQLAEDWLQAKGYFTRTNLKFKPAPTHTDFISDKDSVPSDIDVIGVNPNLRGALAVIVVSCKSGQQGIHIDQTIKKLIQNPFAPIGNKEAWKHFRELVIPKWAEALKNTIKNATGSTKFTYVTAVTTIRDNNNKSLWENNPTFRASLSNNPIQIISLDEMLTELFANINTKGYSLETSQLSRTLQLIKAAGLNLKRD